MADGPEHASPSVAGRHRDDWRPSALFRHIATLQGDRPWGRLLDAGTGANSIRWVAALATSGWTAVTGAEGHAIQVRDTIAAMRRPQDRILLGNWADPGLLAGERYDTVLADYLLGAVEGFAPYFQTRLFARLRPLVAGRLYVVGLEPYVTSDAGTEGGRMIAEIGRFRDACLLLAGERPYREYPADWVVEQMAAAGFRILSARHFANRYKAGFVNGQIDMCAPRLAGLADRRLARSLADEGERLREKGLALVARQGGLRHGHDYVIAAEPVPR